MRCKTRAQVQVDFMPTSVGLSVQAPLPVPLPAVGERRILWLSTIRNGWMQRTVGASGDSLELSIHLWSVEASSGSPLWKADLDLMRLGPKSEAHGSVLLAVDDDELAYLGEADLDDIPCLVA
jgi:hypothetical protein